MPLTTEPIQQNQWEDMNQVYSWASSTQENLRRIPIEGFLQNRAEFMDDEYFGDPDVAFRFNIFGLRSLCSHIGFRFDQFSLIETPSLASDVLNDLIRQDKIRKKLEGLEFVVDTSADVVVGIVSDSYVTYSNQEFLRDIDDLLSTLPNAKEITFNSAFGVNTELTLHFVFESMHGEIKGKGGKGSDKSQIGLEFKNSMVGTSSVSLNYFIHRLACANGMMVPTAQSINRVNHSGSGETFNERLEKRFKEGVRKMGVVKNMVERLGKITFDPEKLAMDKKASESVFEISPGLKKHICDQTNIRLRYPPEADAETKRKIKIEHDSKIIGLIPDFIGGEQSKKVFESHWRDNANMFDFLNVFTEEAKNRKPQDRLEIESRAGALAKYIADNARKF